MLYLHFIRIKKLHQGYSTLAHAYEAYSYDYKKSSSLYKGVESVFGTNGDFLMKYGKALSLAEENKQALPILTKAEAYENNTIIQCAIGDVYKALNNYRLAEQAYRQAAFMCPSHFYPQYLLANLYIETRQNEKALKVALEILSKKVKVPSTDVYLIQQEMQDFVLRYRKKH